MSQDRGASPVGVATNERSLTADPTSSVSLAARLGAARWSDDTFLDALRLVGDDAADRCAVALAGLPDSAARARAMFAAMPRNDSRVPADAPAPLRDFFAANFPWCDRCRQPVLAPWVDRERLIRGQTVFMERMVPAVLVLLCKSLPEGYATPGATKILNISGELLTHTYHRLMGTLQLLFNVSSPQSFERAGPALVNAHQMRLLHAGVRAKVAPVVLQQRGGFQAYVDRFGVPINQEDMLATIMAFSLLVVRGWRMLQVPLTDAEADDYYYVWRVFAHEMGIRPAVADDTDNPHLPANLAEAATFYEAYRRRQYAGATKWEGSWLERSTTENPDGVALTQRHLAMLGSILPERESRFFDLAHVAHIYVEMLIGEEGCARVGVPRLAGHAVLRLLVEHLPRWWALVWRRVNGGIHTQISNWFLRSLIGASYERGVVFTVPATLEDLKALVDRGASHRGSMISAAPAS